MNKRLQIVVLISIIVFGVFLRFCGLGTNIQYGGIYHPDAGKQIAALARFLEGDYLNYTQISLKNIDDVYPNLTMHLIEWSYRKVRRVRFWVLNLLGFRTSLDSLDTVYKYNHLILYHWVRILLALMSCATIYLIYRVGVNYFGVSIGILASFFFAISPLSVDLAHVEMSDTAAVFFAVCCLYFVSRNFIKENLYNYIAAGFAAGFAAGAKYYGGIIVMFPLFTSLYFSIKKNSKCYLRALCSYKIYLILIALCLGIFVSMPHLWQNFAQKFKDTLMFIDHMANLDERLRAVPRSGLFFKHLAENYFIMKSAVYPVVFYAGLAYMIFVFLYRRSFNYIMIAVFPIIYFLVTAYGRPYGMMALYYLITIPFFCILSSLLLRELFIKKAIIGKLSSISIGLILLSSTGYDSLTSAYLFLCKDTRRYAEEWMLRNTISGVDAFGDKYSLGVPLKERSSENKLNFYFSSSLGEDSIPLGGRLIKEFSLENKIPLILHRNPDIKVYLLTGNKTEKSFDVSDIPHKPADPDEIEMIFVDGLDFGETLKSFHLEGCSNKLITLVSYKKLSTVKIAVTNDSSDAKVDVSLGGDLSRVKIAPFATEAIKFEAPKRSFPYTKYFYRLKIRNRDKGKIFIEIDTGVNDSKKLSVPAEYLAFVNRSVFRASDLIVPNKKEIVDKNAFENKAVLLEGASNIIYGPYKFFPKGRWKVSFKMRLKEKGSDKEVSVIDVVSRSGEKILGKKQLKAEDFSKNEYKYFIIPIDITEQAEVLEFRVKISPGVSLIVDQISIQPDIQ